MNLHIDVTLCNYSLILSDIMYSCAITVFLQLYLQPKHDISGNASIILVRKFAR